MSEVLSTQDEQLASLPGCFSLYHRQTSANKMLLRPRFSGLYDINWKSSEIFQRTYALLLLVQFKVVPLFSTLFRAMKLKLFTCCNYPKRPQTVKKKPYLKISECTLVPTLKTDNKDVPQKKAKWET